MAASSASDADAMTCLIIVAKGWVDCTGIKKKCPDNVLDMFDLFLAQCGAVVHCCELHLAAILDGGMLVWCMLCLLGHFVLELVVNYERKCHWPPLVTP